MPESTVEVHRVAGVDVGSNAIRFLAVEFGPGGERDTLAYGRVPVRLGTDAFRTGELPTATLTAVGGAFGSFRTALDLLAEEGRPVERLRGVATSAVRESRNGAAVAGIARRVAGFELETITGAEEARLVWRAARDRVAGGGWLLVDLGGGSLEVSLARGGDVEWTESHAVGTVRLLETPERAEAALARVRIPRLDDAGLDGLIATGGNIEALARLAGVEPEGGARRGEVSRLPVRALAAVNEAVAALKPKKRVKELGLRKDRADVIVPAGRVYARLAELAGAAEIVVPHVGVLDGIVAELGARSRAGGEDGTS